MSRFEWFRLLVWPIEIFTARKNFFGNPILGSEKLNRMGLHVWRTVLAYRLAECRRARLKHLVSAKDRDAFHEMGFVEKRNFLEASDFKQLADEVMQLRADATEFREGDAVTRQIVVTPDVLRHAPALRKLVCHPQYQGLIRYVGSFNRPPYIYVQTVFSRTGASMSDPQTALHIDTFHPTVKAWFFLEDVDDGSGPFSYVAGSHRLTQRRLAWHKRKSIVASRQGGPKGGAFRLTAEDLKRLRLPEPTVFTVPANTLVVGDTFGVHARTPSGNATRRIEIWAFSRTSPFWPFAGHPWWMIPGIERFELKLYLTALRLAQSLGLGKNKTPFVGKVTASEEVRSEHHCEL